MDVNHRNLRAKYNIVFSLISRFVAAICGLVVSKILIKAFGSEAYGATDSIAKFLAYISLLDGGVSGVARAALYKPLADNDYKKVSELILKMKRFFRVVALIFLVYVAVLACTYKSIAHVEFLDWSSTALLVVVISVSTFMEYFLGISYGILINASQRTYVNQVISIVTNIVNAVVVALFVGMGHGLVFVKLISCIVLLSRPVLTWLYVKKVFDLPSVSGVSSAPDLLDQKWIGFAQHIAFVIHSNTDVIVLTIFGDLKLVAVYSVYFMVISGIQKVALSFTSGMEALFGELLAKKEYDNLDRTFDKYESMISVVSGVLFSVTAVMIVPFVGIYTADVTDVDYIYPAFSLLLVLATYLFCIRMPYHAMVTASGSFRQTQIASYGESAVNIVLSVVLVIKFGLIGVAIGTVAAVLFRFLYYVVFLSRDVMRREIGKFVMRMAGNALSFVVAVISGNVVTGLFAVTGYITWGLAAACVTAVSCAVWCGTEWVIRHCNK